MKAPESDDFSMTEDALLTSALLDKLSLSPEQRIEAHQAALQLIADLKLAGEQIRAESK